VVADGGRLLEFVRRRYADCEVTGCASFLSGISELTRHPARAVIAFVDAGARRLDAAVAGLREAAGTGTRVVLCCPPEAEPRVRPLLHAGADDYIVYPVQPDELDTAIGYEAESRWHEPALAPAPAASMEELQALSRVLANLDGTPSRLLDQLNELLRVAMRCDTVVISVDGLRAGDASAEDLVLVEPIVSDNRTIGQIGLAARPRRPFSTADSQKLRHYATLASHLLRAASKNRRWRELAMTDEVTGLPNRRYLAQWLGDLIERARRERFRVTLLVFDIDDFKTYNDTQGHDVGDEVLRVTGELFRRHCREHDLVVRYGGDEFAVVFWDAEQPRVAGSRHPSDAVGVLRRCTDALRAHEFPRLGPHASGVLTISGGLATFPWHADGAEALIRRADEALLKAKQAGKDRIYLIGQGKEPYAM
jgi:diguanylate cyclase (GGDEF)-like protein